MIVFLILAILFFLACQSVITVMMFLLVSSLQEIDEIPGRIQEIAIRISDLSQTLIEVARRLK